MHQIPDAVFREGPAQLPKNPPFSNEATSEQQYKQTEESRFLGKTFETLCIFAATKCAGKDNKYLRDACFHAVDIIQQRYEPYKTETLIEVFNLLKAIQNLHKIQNMPNKCDAAECIFQHLRDNSFTGKELNRFSGGLYSDYDDDSTAYKKTPPSETKEGWNNLISSFSSIKQG